MEFDEMLREVFGDSFTKLSQFQSDQVKKFSARIQDIAREGMKEELAKLASELNEVKARVAVLEAERMQNAAEGVESPF